MFGIYCGMLFKTEMRSIIANGPVGLKIPRELKRLAVFIPITVFSLAAFTLFFQFILTQRPAGGFDQPGIHGNTLVDGKALLFELAQDLGVDLVHGFFGQPAAEAGESRMIRSRLAERKPQEAFEGQPVVDLVFQLGVGLNPEPLLQEQAFEEHQWRVGRPRDFFADQLMVALSCSMRLMQRFCSRQLARGEVSEV